MRITPKRFILSTVALLLVFLGACSEQDLKEEYAIEIMKIDLRAIDQMEVLADGFERGEIDGYAFRMGLFEIKLAEAHSLMTLSRTERFRTLALEEMPFMETFLGDDEPLPRILPVPEEHEILALDFLDSLINPHLMFVLERVDE